MKKSILNKLKNFISKNQDCDPKESLDSEGNCTDCGEKHSVDRKLSLREYKKINSAFKDWMMGVMDLKNIPINEKMAVVMSCMGVFIDALPDEAKAHVIGGLIMFHYPKSKMQIQKIEEHPTMQ